MTLLTYPEAADVLKVHVRTLQREIDADVLTTANSYFGLLRQTTHSHHDRARLANLVRQRGHSVDAGLTKTFGTSPKETQQNA